LTKFGSLSKKICGKIQGLWRRCFHRHIFLPNTASEMAKVALMHLEKKFMNSGTPSRSFLKMTESYWKPDINTRNLQGCGRGVFGGG
jgi:hypothetical protein